MSLARRAPLVACLLVLLIAAAQVVVVTAACMCKSPKPTGDCPGGVWKCCAYQHQVDNSWMCIGSDGVGNGRVCFDGC